MLSNEDLSLLIEQKMTLKVLVESDLWVVEGVRLPISNYFNGDTFAFSRGFPVRCASTIFRRISRKYQSFKNAKRKPARPSRKPCFKMYWKRK